MMVYVWQPQWDSHVHVIDTLIRKQKGIVFTLCELQIDREDWQHDTSYPVRDSRIRTNMVTPCPVCAMVAAVETAKELDHHKYPED